jgi:hypothetical protein
MSVRLLIWVAPSVWAWSPEHPEVKPFTFRNSFQARLHLHLSAADPGAADRESSL